jgi:hypothetical protein
MTRELHAIGNNLNQLARIANATNSIDSDKLRIAVSTLNAALRDINDAVVMPRKTVR